MDISSQLSKYLALASVQHIVVAGSEHPRTTTDMHEAYTKDLRTYLYHGSHQKISKFVGPLFLSGSSLAASYAHEGYLYKCKVQSKNPLVLIENRDRMTRTGNNSPNGMLISGTDTELRDFVRTELLSGAPDSLVRDFDGLYKRRGIDVPARLFCNEDCPDGWAIVSKNLVRLGYDSMLFNDESFDTQFRGAACFVPDSAIVSIVDVSDISEYGEFREDFDTN